MNELFKRLLAALQDELQEYGALLHLFDLQRECIDRHDPAGFLEINPRVEQQLEKLTRYRLEREALVRDTAVEYGHSPASTLTALLPDCPQTRQPLLQALIEEINHLTVRTRRRVRQNCALLAGCVEASRELAAAGDGGAPPETYSARGERSVRISSKRTSATLA